MKIPRVLVFNSLANLFRYAVFYIPLTQVSNLQVFPTAVNHLGSTQNDKVKPLHNRLIQYKCSIFAKKSFPV